MSAAVIPEPIAQLQRQLDEIRGTQPRGKRLPDSVWQVAVELAREHGVYSVARHLRLDYAGLKKRLGGVPPRRRKTRKPTFVELFAPPSAMQGECLIELELLHGSKVRIQWKAATSPDWMNLLRAANRNLRTHSSSIYTTTRGLDGGEYWQRQPFLRRGSTCILIWWWMA
jgi:hypothetical protein